MSSPVTALVVETNYLIASAIENPLTKSGFKVVVALDEAEAREAIVSYDIAVAIIDFSLRHGGPDALVSQLDAARVPYIFCTAASAEEVEEHFPGARVLEKPFGDDLLLSLVAEAARYGSEPLHSRTLDASPIPVPL